MDLVDIDQVLNDLELSVAADELSQEARSPPQTAAPASAAAASGSARHHGDGAHSSGTKSFVGVSQVFNSLDVYRNNVKSLEEQRTQQYNWQQAEDEADGELQYSEDLQKFKEPRPTHVYSDDAPSVSDSLTTSSCSTFSSGPSLGNDSSLAEHANLPTAETVEPAAAPTCNEDQEEDDEVADLALGLSSVSITTAGGVSSSQLHCEVTPSSVLGRVLGELTVTEVSTSASQRTPESADCPSTKELPLQEIERPQPPTVAPTVVQLQLAAAEAGAPPPKQAQPMTFCSTMDEISDTELDSMLQEIDADESISRPALPVVAVEPPITAAAVASDDGSEPDVQSQSSEHLNADNFSQASTVEFAEIKNPAEAEEAKEDVADELAKEAFDDQAKEASARPERPTTLDLPVAHSLQLQNAGQTPPPGADYTSPDDSAEESEEQQETPEEASGVNDQLGHTAPIWVPDDQAPNCMLCAARFTLLRRRHHCRACGKVYCSMCCSQRWKLEFMQEPESRVCSKCYAALKQPPALSNAAEQTAGVPARSPNPNNPMEYCSTISPYQQVDPSAPPPTVIVPVGVLKKEGSVSSSGSSNSSGKYNAQGQVVRKRKSVMFSDGVAPGSELASDLEQQAVEAKQTRRNAQQASHKPATPAHVEPRTGEQQSAFGMMAQLFRGALPAGAAAMVAAVTEGSLDTSAYPSKGHKKLEKLPTNFSWSESSLAKQPNALPPIAVAADNNCDSEYVYVKNDFSLVQRLCKETLKFVLRKNFYVYAKIANLSCCMNRTVINFTTSGMRHVGNDEIIILLEVQVPVKAEDLLEPLMPRDIFLQLNDIYANAENEQPVSELCFVSLRSHTFLGSVNYGGFIFIRATYQCLQDIILPENPYLIGVLIHRNEVPWAKIFPLRLILRLGAQCRYYPCPLISMQHREPVYAEIAQTIINFLADFRNYEYSLPQIHGLYIHMEERQTTVLIPRNRHEEVIRAVDNASDHLLAFAGNFSVTADGHLVCMQNVDKNDKELHVYSTQAINIQGQPRKVTGASFFVLSEALKSNSGLTGKCTIVEDGLMVQITPTKMEEIRSALRCQQDINIVCGPIEAKDELSEVVSIKWTDNDREFNIGVNSPIDNMSMAGVVNMRVHANFNAPKSHYTMRLADIYIIKCDLLYNTGSSERGNSSRQLTEIAALIANSAASALDLSVLAKEGTSKLGLRVTLDQENVCYEAGADGVKLSPQYMNALDDKLVGVLHNQSDRIEDTVILELVFYILEL